MTAAYRASVSASHPAEDSCAVRAPRDHVSRRATRASWYAAFAGDEGVAPLIAIITNASTGEPAVLLPLIRRQQSNIATVEFADLDLTDYNAPILGSAAPRDAKAARALWRSLLSALRRMPEKADLIRLRKVPVDLDGKPNPIALLDAAGPCALNGNLVFTGEDYDAWRYTLEKTVRKELERSWRVFTRDPAASFALITDTSEALRMKGTPLADVADGLHDTEFEAAARAISEAHPQAIIRLGWEMNLSDMARFAKGHEADYIKAFRRVVEIFRRHSAGFKFDWCPGWGPQEMPADASYPGDDVVDYIGLDVYDFKHEGLPEERWNIFYVTAEFGLEWHRDFALRHGKRMSYPEWGVGNFGDNPFFVQQMHDWFMKNEDRIAYAAYFDVDGAWPTRIDNGQFPNSQRLFRKLFSR